MASTGPRSRGAGSRAGEPRWSSPSTRSPLGTPTASRPAVVRSTPGVRQYDASPRSVAASRTMVSAAATAQTSSSSWTSSPVERRRDEHERRRAVELRRLLRAADLLQPRQRLRPEHAEAPRLRQMVVRRQPGEVEQLEQRLARNRVRPELLVRPPGADELREVHARLSRASR